MKKNAIASLLLAAAAAAAAPADNLGTASLVGDLSSTSDYVYTADQADAIVSAAKTAAVAYTTAVSNGVVWNVTIEGTPISHVDGTVAIQAASSANYGVVRISDASTTGDFAALPTGVSYASTPMALSNVLQQALSAAASVAYTHPTYTARTGKPTANASPTWGGTFTVSQIKSDATGHVTDAVDRTITIPSAAATTSAAGLMSAADKTSLDALSSGSVLKTTVSAALTAQGISSADDIDTLNETIDEIKKVIAVLEALD